MNVHSLSNRLVDSAAINAGGEFSDDLLEAFRGVLRHEFLDEFKPPESDRWRYKLGGAWQEEDLEEIYTDRPLALTIKGGVVVCAQSRPSFLLSVLRELKLERGGTVLEIGYASGWLLAIASHLLGERGQVWGYEIEEQLGRLTSARLSQLGYSNVTAYVGDVGACDRRNFDYILSTSAAVIPNRLGRLLAPKGRCALAIALPGGTDCTVVFQRDGEAAHQVAAWYSVSVPGRASLALHCAQIECEAAAVLKSGERVELPSKPFEHGRKQLPYIEFREYLAATDPRFCLVRLHREDGKHQLSFGIHDAERGHGAVVTRFDIRPIGSPALVSDLAEAVEHFANKWSCGRQIARSLIFDSEDNARVALRL